MPNIESLVSPLRDLWNRTAAASGPAPGTPVVSDTEDASAPQSLAETNAKYDAAIKSLPNPSLSLPIITAKLDPVGAKLDELLATLKGPYTVMHQTVESGAQFRMVDGYNQSRVSANSDDGRLLSSVATKAGLSQSDVMALQQGRGEPRALVKLTQALIDAGQYPGGTGKPAADQIHAIQWRFGIGVDCAGYVYRAVAAIHGDPAKLGLKATGFENFTGLPRNAHFTTAKFIDVKAGDILVLAGNGTSANPGHNLIVRSHSPASLSGKSVAERWPQSAAFLAAPNAVVHVIEVDSSFGAGKTGAPDGGVRRDVVLYDATTKAWCTCTDTKPPTVTVDAVPYGEEAITGFFRANVQR
jgi:hypothetical protein